MDRSGVGRNKGVEFAERVLDFSAIEARQENSLLFIDPHDRAEIAVEDLLIVVDLGLHDLVAGQEYGAEALDP